MEPTTEEKAPVISIDTIQKTLKEPGLLESFFTEDSTMKFSRRTSATGKEEFALAGFFPFFTVYDLKLFLYKYSGENPRWAPEYQFLAIRRPLGLYPLEYQWRRPGTEEVLHLQNPYNTSGVRAAANEFITETGERKALSYTSLQRFTVESMSASLKLQGKEILLFLYDDVKAAAKATDERLWNTHLYPYFPSLSYEKEEIDSALLKNRFEKFSAAYKITTSLEELLEGNYEAPKHKGFRLLQFSWKQATERDNVEPLFYNSAVTRERPFMRILPSKGTPVLKIHLKEDDTPDLADIRLLRQWTKERNPVPEHDFLLVKVLLKEQIAQQPPIYMTLRLTDITADATIIPPKGIRKLDFVNDLPNLTESFTKGIEQLDLTGDLQISKATLNYRIDLEPSAPILSKKIIRRRLIEKFMPFFEEIESLPGEPSLITLRYKAVNNYASEGRVFAFLTQYLTRKDTIGEGLPENIIEQVAKEFKLDDEEAERYVTKWLKSRGKYDAVDSSEFVEVNNTGIEVSIIAQHPWYHVNLYNVDTLENLRRILMLLTMMVMTPDSAIFKETERGAARVYASVVAEEKKEVEEEEREEDDEAPAAVAPNAEVEAADDDLAVFDAADMGDFGVEFGEEEAEGVRGFVEKDKEEFDEQPPATVVPKVTGPPPPSVAVAAPPREENEESVVSVKETGLADFFLTKLKEADKRLFDYTKTHPSLKKYVSMCAANVTRQPAVVSYEQFIQMKDTIYAEDITSGRINFIRYPLEEKEKSPNKGADETFYFLRYGTTPQKNFANYYVCSKYFCTRDNLILIEKDFLETRARTLDGRIGAPGTKKESSCPFCGGILVRNRRNPGPNETVLIRQEAPKTNKQFHTHIGFLKKTPHPEKDIYLPCCFLKPQEMRITDEQFKRAREFSTTGAPSSAAATSTAPEKMMTVRVVSSDEKPIISKTRIQQVIARTPTRYIIGSEKLPLEVDPEEGAQIGLCPPEVDMFFGQTNSDFVTPRNPHKLKPDARGFLRLGVENRVRFKTDSFLAAIAPYYFVETAHDMKKLIFKSLQLQPALFFQLNYGNFLLEWYSPNEEQPDLVELQRFLEGEDTNSWGDILQIVNYETNPDAAKRFYVSWHRFEQFLFSGDRTKEYRQFAALLAQPDFLLRLDAVQEETLQRPGITFIVINIGEDKSVEIQCPPYGFNNLIHGKNDVAFLIHHSSGIWEPLYYIDNRSAREPYTLFFQRGEEEAWPPIVKQRITEFMSMGGCASDGKLSYSAWPDAPYAKAMLTTSRLRQDTKGSIQLHGMLRDTYNHLSALLFESPGGSSGSIPVPCIDNGLLIPTTKIYLSRDDLRTAHPKIIRDFYTNYIMKIKIPFVKKYAIKELWYNKEEEGADEISILGMSLENGVFVPLNYAEPLDLEELHDFGFKVVAKHHSALLWLTDEKIVFEKPEDEEEEEGGISGKEIQDIFEHLRITFANYLARSENKALIENIWKIVESSESLYDKRKSMEILLGSTIQGWFSTNEPTGAASFQRVDCRMMKGKDQCAGRCALKDDEQCAIHAPEFTKGERRVKTVDMLLYKLIEELLRFSQRRRELLENDVSYMKIIDKPIQQGDQYIIPENTPAWYELLRGDWLKTTDEKGIFFEELSSPAAPEELGELAAPEPSTNLPESLVTYLGKEDPKTATFRLLRIPIEELLNILQKLRGKNLPRVSGAVLTREEMNALHKGTKIPIAQIDIRSPDAITTLFADSLPHRRGYFVIIQTTEGPALLVRDPADPHLPEADELPKNLRTDFERSLARARNAATKKRPILVSRVKAPAPVPSAEEV